LMDDPELLVSNMFSYVGEHRDGTSRNQILHAMVENLTNNQPSQELVRELLAILVANSDVRSVDYSLYKRLLQDLLEAAEKHTESPDELREMFSLLLDKAHVLTSPSPDILKTILDVTIKRVKEFKASDVIDDMWKHLASKVKKQAIIELAKPF